MDIGSLTKVLHDFLTTTENEINLNKGDYFLIHKIIDKHWCYGQSHNRFGKFPINYLHKVEIPAISNNELLFISIAPFRGEGPDDLTFNKGEIIIGNAEASCHLFNGHIGARRGLFSSSYVWQLDLSLMQKALTKTVVNRRAKVIIDLKAQLDEELDLMKGEIVTVTEILHDGWCRGYKENGEEGTFPESFITYQEDIIIDAIEQNSGSSSLDDEFSISSSTRRIYKNIDDIYPDTVEYQFNNPLSNYDAIFPNSEISNSQLSLDYNQHEIITNVIAQFSFIAQFPNELSFQAGQIIQLIKYIDNEWAEGKINNVRGIFPVSFVKLYCDESFYDTEQNDVPLVQNNESSNDQMDINAIKSETIMNVELMNPDYINGLNNDDENDFCSTNYSTAYLNTDVNSFQEPVEDFIITGEQKDYDEKEFEQIKKLYEPHRAAPPTPVLDQITSENLKNVAMPLKQEINFPSFEQKKADRRQNVIIELYLTEKDYVRDLKMTYETFNLHDPSYLISKGIDVTTLFGNISEIIDVAEEFFELIQQSIEGSDLKNNQCIGSCFLQISEKMRISYGKYCSNHELSLALLQKYENKEEIMKIFHKGVETLRMQVACFDMNSILIKPVQRILRYSLILNQLLKFTEDDHPEKLKIEEASKVMADVGRYINEYKRKKELASKYLHSNNTLIGKMANLNMHSVAKKSSRLGAKLSATLGITNLPTDNKFDELERNFVSLEKNTKQFLKNVVNCISYLDNESQCSEVLTEHIHQYFSRVQNNEILQLRRIRNAVRSRFVKQLKACIEIRVISPLNVLITLLAGPELLINKRHDKMLDYDAAISRNEKFKERGTIPEDLSISRSNFEALNQQLLEELPICIQASTAILYNCIHAFTNARKLYNRKIMKEYLNISECVTLISIEDMLANFTISHKVLYDKISRLSFASAGPRLSKECPSSCLQSNTHRIALKMKYPPSKLYAVARSVHGATPHDLTVTKGTMVGVIKTQDPTGDILKWFVDTGSSKGFIESQYLQLSSEGNNAEEAVSLDSADNSVDLMSLDSPEVERDVYSTEMQNFYANVNDKPSFPPAYANISAEPKRLEQRDCEFVHAIYDFHDELNPGTLSIRKGQTLKVLKKNTNEANTHWWLVEDRTGGKGYVPHDHLRYKQT